MIIIERCSTMKHFQCKRKIFCTQYHELYLKKPKTENKRIEKCSEIVGNINIHVSLADKQKLKAQQINLN